MLPPAHTVLGLQEGGRVTHLIQIVVEFGLTILLADFIAGVVHWLQDAYGRPDFPITGPLFTQPNIQHHRQPRYFTRHSWLKSSWDLLLLNGLILLAAFWLDRLTWQVWLFAIVGTNANQIHKWAHRTPRENGAFITLLHRLRLLQTPRHHARHHTDPKNSHYCTITNVLNPLLDAIHFWNSLEWCIYSLTGVRRRSDPTVRQFGGRVEDQDAAGAAVQRTTP